VLLAPLSWIFFILVVIRRTFQTQINPNPSLKVPVIVIGNINIGGTGKTPLVIAIARYLKDAGYKPGIVSRGYKGNSSIYPILLNKRSQALDVGDEPLLLADICPVTVDPNRYRAANYLLEKTDCDLILSDDGLQHYNMNRDIEIVVIDGKRRFGNNLSFPAGPLRESLKRLDSVDFIVNNSGPTEDGEHLMNVSPAKFIHLKSGKSYSVEDWPMHKQVHAVAGLGNPGRFFDLLERLGFDITRNPFPDHHNFISEDVHYLDHLPIIMTEKDASKCKDFDNNKIWYLTIEAEVSSKFMEQLDSKLKNLS